MEDDGLRDPEDLHPEDPEPPPEPPIDWDPGDPGPVHEPDPPPEPEAEPQAAGAPPAPRWPRAAPPPPPPPPGPPPDPIEGLLPSQEAHICAGSSGAGKTTWLGWLCAQLLNSSEVFGCKINRPPFIGYIAGDRLARDAVEKLKRAGWESPNWYGLIDDQSENTSKMLRNLRFGRPSINSDFPFFRQTLTYFAEKYCGASVLPRGSFIIVDGMALILGIDPGASYIKIAAPLALLNRIAAELGITILLVHHTGKQPAPELRYARPQDRIGGSMALLGYSSTQIALIEPELTEDPVSGLHDLLVFPHGARMVEAKFRRSKTSGLFELVSDGQVDEATRESASAAIAGRTWPVQALLVLEKIPWEGPGPDGAQPAKPMNVLELHLQFPHISKPTFYRYLENFEQAKILTSEKVGRAKYYRRRGSPPAVDPRPVPASGSEQSQPEAPPEDTQ